MTRVAHIDTGHEMRGGQWQVLYLMSGLAECGHSQILLSPDRSPLFEQARARGWNVQRVSVATIARAQADVWHAHDARAHTLASVALRRPLLVSRRVAFPLQRGLASRLKYARPSHFIAVSRFVERILLNAGIPPDKISVVYDGVELPALPAHPDRTLTVAIDSPDPAKGRTIIERAAHIAGVPVHFTLDLPRDLPHAAAFLYISDCEGLGSAALLAMAHGVPVIASSVGGLPEIVRHNETGLLVPNEPQQIALAMRRLLDDPVHAQALGRNGRGLVEANFTTGRMVAGTVRTYERMFS